MSQNQAEGSVRGELHSMSSHLRKLAEEWDARAKDLRDAIAYESTTKGSKCLNPQLRLRADEINRCAFELRAALKLTETQ